MAEPPLDAFVMSSIDLWTKCSMSNFLQIYVEQNASPSGVDVLGAFIQMNMVGQNAPSLSFCAISSLAAPFDIAISIYSSETGVERPPLM